MRKVLLAEYGRPSLARTAGGKQCGDSGYEGKCHKSDLATSDSGKVGYNLQMMNGRYLLLAIRNVCQSLKEGQKRVHKIVLGKS